MTEAERNLLPEPEETEWLPEILTPDGDWELLYTLPASYRWAGWLQMELNALNAPADDRFGRYLNLHFPHGVLLSGSPGNGRHTVSRALLRSMGRDYLSVDGLTMEEKGEEAYSEGLLTVLDSCRENGVPLCLLIEDLSRCPWADALTDLLEWYLEADGDPHQLFLILLEDEWKIPEKLRKYLLSCEFHNPDREERAAYLRQNLMEPPLTLESGGMETLEECTAGFSYVDLTQLIHWLRVRQRDVFLKTYEPQKRRLMSEEEYRQALRTCELRTEEIAKLLGLLRKTGTPEERTVPGMLRPMPTAVPDTETAAEPADLIGQPGEGEDKNAFFLKKLRALPEDKRNEVLARRYETYQRLSAEKPTDTDE